MKSVQIYTDGACSGNPGPGGWGAYLIYGKHKKHLSGYQLDTTNNQMELKAAIMSLQALKEPCKIDLYTDSVYVQKGITEWIDGWIRNNWRSKSKKPVKNVELWQELYDAIQKHDINWHWVKGHANIEGNEIADQLAVEQRIIAQEISAKSQ